ncbi:SwmB domain-containing protein [Amycolatopsis taiwanensis]|uniref:SwmB domain-containing protein n=1 Tax=Amycolatopsis taiwanensis TaxID=342230 RepID=UPI000485B5FF|nr:SwmB domain-containing protein [Amycolatopsis taiwanensis]
MILKQRLGRYALAALVGISLSVASGGIASATTGSPDSGGGDIARLRLSGTCGDQLDMRLRTVGGPLKIAITIPSADPTEQWTITATEQDYGVVTGGRVGNPVDLIGSGLLPPPAFNSVEGGFSTEGFVPNTSGVTHGFSYVATRTSPTPITCTNTGYWTTPSGASGPTAQNPTGKPNTPPALTGATEADTGANDAALQFDQEMLTTAQGTPDTSRFSITVDGVARTVTGVAITDDSPPAHAIVDITFDGAPLTSGQTVAVAYRQPLTGGAPALQDMDSLQTASFGPVSIPVF